ncbi:lysophospholipid acyltransferase family protein [Polaribacter undariae]|uniref:Lysophospholipid acyltransferase family protein n=1 Tax=Polaribacter sejongensis TaxID=985043 RepID=A0AAJ1VFV8_9FLAO|nr:lysophospholipid acyltransferase family protein [Polaribacter undariae]MDN3618669.1 lysophospholipid acyltransferase family protein [Polaribacter undariae]UWD30352.1 lysophospholipid acyltransferase family protein [Polaribacter undariae]
MALVTAKEISQVIGLHKFGFLGTFIGWILLRILRISAINRIYDKNKNKKDLNFLNSILDDCDIKFEIPEEDLKRIPKDGPFITVSNHPLGGIDGVLLLKLLIEKRADYKIIANFLLHRVEPLKPFVMPVNPFESRKDAKSSVAGIKNALLHLREGNPLGIFPAGEVSTYKDGKLNVDKPWEEGAVRFIKKANVPVIPIYFHAKNSRLFYFLSKISDTLRTAKLPSEVISQGGKVIKVRIGKPISVKDQDEFKEISDFSEFIRKKTYMLANPFEKAHKLLSTQNIKIKKTAKKITPQRNTSLFVKEIDVLRRGDGRLLESKNYEVFFASAKEIPNLLHEIGRLREVTFRAVGEGTNKEIDLDKFDKYYHHLLLWDREANCLAGAYRMGLGKDIYKKYGINGFYIQTLFRIEPELYQMMDNTIEMGRAFIIGEYQQKPMPLFLLWKGIVHVTLRYPEYKYLMGGVSISNQFSDFSKSLMIEFMKSHYYDPYIAQYIHPKKEYKVKLKDGDKDFVFDATKADMQKFDKIIDEIEPGALRIPVLIKKYVKQNARLVAFNVDPKFNNAVDGLMYIKVSEIPDSTVKPVMEEFQAELERKATELQNK